MKPILIISMPAYNEELSIARTSMVLLTELDKLINLGLVSEKSSLLYVDDGSSDQTWNTILKENTNNSRVQGLRLSRNFGHQYALLAGLEFAKKHSDICITMDADLQHEPAALKDFIQKYLEGHEIVYGVRENRSDERFLKKLFSNLFYKLQKMMGIKIIENHADYRLMSTKALEALFQYSERNLFLRGIIPTLGFKSCSIFYKQLNREEGVTKYSLKRMLSLALDGITSFSVTPLRFIFVLGLFSCALSFLGIMYTLYTYFDRQAIAGWASTLIAVYFLGGVQLISVGIIGEYIGKIYKEVKARPRVIVADKTQSSA